LSVERKSEVSALQKIDERGRGTGKMGKKKKKPSIPSFEERQKKRKVLMSTDKKRDR